MNKNTLWIILFFSLLLNIALAYFVFMNSWVNNKKIPPSQVTTWSQVSTNTDTNTPEETNVLDGESVEIEGAIIVIPEVESSELIEEIQKDEVTRLIEGKSQDNTYYVYEYLQSKDISACDKIQTWDYVTELSELCQNIIKDGGLNTDYINEFSEKNIKTGIDDFKDLINILYTWKTSCEDIDTDVIRYFECKSLLTDWYDVKAWLNNFDKLIRVDKGDLETSIQSIVSELSLDADIIPVAEYIVQDYYSDNS